MAMVLSAYVSVFAEGLVNLARDEVSLLMGVRDEVERLHSRLDRLLPVLADADKRSLQDRAIGHWVKQLKDVIYDAEDIVERYMTEAKKLKRSTSSMVISCFASPLSRFSHHIVHGHQTGNKIKALNGKLDDIIKDISVLNLRSGLDVDVCGHNMINGRISNKVSCLPELELIGESIEDDTEKLVNMMLAEGSGSQEKKISVFAISGMGGVGKTTLAQKVFHDYRLRTKFNRIPPIWVCVSQDFTEVGLLRSIITGAGGIPGGAGEKQDLELLLHETVKDQRIFVVLDDVWDAQVWIKVLSKPLQWVLAGSVILVTTRKESIVAQMRAKYCHLVRKLSDEDGWSLLCKVVFQDGEVVADMQHPLREVGIRIVRKCDGLPLAIRSVAGVLLNKAQRPQDWEHVLQSLSCSLPELPEDVMGALYFSYADLPSHLKQCFLYFALFPEDAKLYVNQIVRLWIAEGFVETKEDMLMEDVGRQYWKELVQRNVLQPDPQWYDSSCCKMHDLLQSLARHMASGESFCTNSTDKMASIIRSQSTMKPRRLHFWGGGAHPKAIEGHPSLRTLLLQSIRSLPNDGFATMKYLRTLSIEFSPIEKLPDSIGSIKLLRYLNLSGSAVRDIPESIGRLENLQYLILFKCKNLRKLPNSIKNLRSLRCLQLEGVEIHVMPEWFEELHNLVELGGFRVSDGESDCDKSERRSPESKHRDCNICRLGSLSLLQHLTLYNLERVSTMMEASAADLRSKIHLIFLTLSCTSNGSNVQPQAGRENEEIERRISSVFDELRPPPSLQSLLVEGYFGLEFPSWMMNRRSSFLPNLRRLKLVDCILCEQLPPLGLLPQLDFLWIQGAPAVKSIGPELFGLPHTGADYATCIRSFFPKLETLILRNMPNWEEWCWLGEEHVKATVFLPSLYDLRIVACPKLRSLPTALLCHATALARVFIDGAQSVTEIGNLLFVETMILRDNPHLERVLNLPALRDLRLTNCKEVKDVEGLGALQYLEIEDPGMQSLPEWLCPLRAQEQRFGALRRLIIGGDGNLLPRCLVGAPDWHKIWALPRVDVYCSNEPDSQIHYTKSPFSFHHHLGNNSATNQQQAVEHQQ